MHWSMRKCFGPWGQDWKIVSDARPDDKPAEDHTPRIGAFALAQARAAGRPAPPSPWQVAEPAPGVVPSGMAMDWQAGAQANLYGWAQTGAFSEGVTFLGYPYLAELLQRPEYRQIVKKYAEHMTRKWIKLVGGSDEYRDRLAKAMLKFKVQDVIREALEHDGTFGRAQIFVDLGVDQGPELTRPLTLSPNKLSGKLRNLKTVEPIWSYPGRYQSTNPLHRDYYRPQEWYVSGQTVHASRMITIVGREVPDMLKPAYAFGGLARTQMSQPYVENWLRTRQSISDLIHSFTVWVLKSKLSNLFSGLKQAMGSVMDRVELFNIMRDNSGTFLIDKDSEEFENVTANISGLDKLQLQALEQICVSAAIPVSEFCGTTPNGLNASSEGEIRTFYTNIATEQERMLREPLTYIMQIIQFSVFGSVQEDVSFEFEPLWEMSAKELSDIELNRQQIDSAYVGSFLVTAEEARERVNDDETSQYHGRLKGPPPEPEPEEDDTSGDDDAK